MINVLLLFYTLDLSLIRIDIFSASKVWIITGRNGGGGGGGEGRRGIQINEIKTHRKAIYGPVYLCEEKLCHNCEKNNNQKKLYIMCVGKTPLVNAQYWHMEYLV